MNEMKLTVVTIPSEEIVQDAAFKGRAAKVRGDKLTSLVNSIEEIGQQIPVVGWQDETGCYHLEDGFTRIAAIQSVNARRAAKGQDPFKVEFLVKPAINGNLTGFKFAANQHRNNLTPVDVLAYVNMLIGEGKSQAEIGRVLGLTRPRINQYARLNELDPSVMKLVNDGTLTVEDGYILSAESAKKQRAVVDLAESFQEEDSNAKNEMLSRQKIRAKYIAKALTQLDEQEKAEASADNAAEEQAETAAAEKPEKAESPTLSLKQFLVAMAEAVEEELDGSFVKVVCQANIDLINKSIKWRAFEARLDRAMDQVAAAAEEPLRLALKDAKKKAKGKAAPEPAETEEPAGE